MERSVSHHLYIAHFSYHTFSCPYTSHLCTIACVFANTYLNSHNTCRLPFLQVSRHLFLQPPLSASCSCFHLREWVISPPISLSWPWSSVLLKYMARLYTSSFYVAHPTETLHSNAHDFFFLKPGQLLSVHHDRQILDAKKKEKEKEKKQWKTMTRVPSQSVKCPFSLCTISSSCRPFILRVQRIMHTYN